MRNKLWLAFIVGIYCLALAFPRSSVASSRATHRWGLRTGLLAVPFPSLYSATLSYNFSDYFQIEGGGGIFNSSGIIDQNQAVFSTTALGIAGRLLWISQPWAPFTGLGYTRWNLIGDMMISGEEVTPGTSFLGVVYASAGVDWQSSGGLNLGLGAHYILYPPEITHWVRVVPEVYIGWFF